MDLATLVPWATAGFGTGAGFLVVRWFVEWLSGRWDKQTETIDKRRGMTDAAMLDLIKALQTQGQNHAAEIQRLSDENKELRGLVDRQRGRERGLEEENDGLRKEVTEMREHIAALEARLSAFEKFFSTLPLTAEQQATIDSLDKTAPARRKRKEKP